MKLEYATIVSNPKKPAARILSSQIAAFLKKHGVKVLSPKSPQRKSGHILITVGGDGTILYNKNRFNLPIFAIGSESSFVCQAIGSNWKEKLMPMISHGYGIEHRTMLSARLDGKHLPDALNEFVIRSKEHRVIRLHLSHDGKSSSFRADGLIFSTATGSKAYAYSCGGKEMPLLSRRYQVVPIAPFRREFRPTMLSPHSKCKLVIEPYCLADAVSDGQFLYPIKKPCTLEVWVAQKKQAFVKPARK